MDELQQGIFNEILKPGSDGAKMDMLPALGEPSVSAAPSDWTASDTKRQLIASGLLGADWAQTRTIAKNPHQYYETNKILGRHPSVGLVNNYFATSMLTNILLANSLPPEYRKLLHYGTIGLEAFEVGRNKLRFGIGMTF